MDFEYRFNKIDTSNDALEARGYLWLIKYITYHIKLDFDPCLTNRLKLSKTIMSEVVTDIGLLVDASVLTKPNFRHKQSLGSLIYWLYDFLDGNQTQLTSMLSFLKGLTSKLLYQIKIYPTVLVCAYHSGREHTILYASIKTSRFRSHRLNHLLEFDASIIQTELTSGTHIKFYRF